MKYEDFLNESAKRITFEVLNEDPIFDKEEYELYRQVRDGDKKAIKNLKNKISTAAWEKRTAADNARKAKKERESAYLPNKIKAIKKDIFETLKNSDEKIVSNAMKFFENPGDADFELPFEYELGYGEEDEYLLSIEIPASMSPIGKRFHMYAKFAQAVSFESGRPEFYEDDRYVLGFNAKGLLFIGGVDDEFVNQFCKKHGLPEGTVTAQEIYDSYFDWETDTTTSFGSSQIAKYCFYITREQAETIKDIVDYLNNHSNVQHAINHTARGRKGDIMKKPEMPKMYQRRRSKYNKRKPR